MTPFDVNVTGIVRGAVPPINGVGTPVSVGTDVLGNLFVSQGIPERTGLAAQGNSWGVMEQSANTNIIFSSPPTTAFAIALYNADTVKSYIVDRVVIQGFTTAISAAAQSVFAIGALVPPSNPINTMSGTLVTPATIYSLSTRVGGYNGAAVVKGAGALTALPAVLASAWTPLGNGQNLAASSGGFSIEAFVYGRYIIRPGAAFIVNLMGTVATGTFLAGVEWHEVQLPLG